MNAEADALPDVTPAETGSATASTESVAPGSLSEDEALIALRDKLAGEDSE
jgi:hypothetical protein